MKYQTKGKKISIWISCIVADKAKGYASECVCVWIWGQQTERKRERESFDLAFVAAKIAGQQNMRENS